MPIVMDADRVGRSLMRIAHEILERNRGTDNLALIGIRARGVPIAERIAANIKAAFDMAKTAVMDIALPLSATVNSRLAEKSPGGEA